MSLVTIDGLRDINRKIEERNDEGERIVAAYEAMARRKEEWIEELESTASTVNTAFANGGLDINDAETIQILKTLLDTMERWVEKYDKICDRGEDGSDFARVAENVCPGLMNRLRALVDEYDDLAENIRLSLQHPEELAELEKLAEELSYRAEPLDVDKWSE